MALEVLEIDGTFQAIPLAVREMDISAQEIELTVLKIDDASYQISNLLLRMKAQERRCSYQSGATAGGRRATRRLHTEIADDPRVARRRLPGFRTVRHQTGSLPQKPRFQAPETPPWTGPAWPAAFVRRS